MNQAKNGRNFRQSLKKYFSSGELFGIVILRQARISCLKPFTDRAFQSVNLSPTLGIDGFFHMEQQSFKPHSITVRIV